MPNLITSVCCCAEKICCKAFTGGWSCGARFSMGIDWTDVYYMRLPGASCLPLMPTMPSCFGTDCDLCAQELNGAIDPNYGYPLDPHCRHYDLDTPKIGTMNFSFAVCAQPISDTPYHNSIALDSELDSGNSCVCASPTLKTCDCETALSDPCCLTRTYTKVQEFCTVKCVSPTGRQYQGTNSLIKTLDGYGAYTNDALVIQSTSAFTARVLLCNRWVSPGDQAAYPTNKAYFGGSPTDLTNCAYLPIRTGVPACPRLDWVAISLVVNNKTYLWNCYGTAHDFANWANANVPGVTVTGSNFWFGLRVPATALEDDCTYAPAFECDQIQTDYTNSPQTFMPDNSDDWLLQSTTATEVKWKCRPAYWYGNTFTLVAENKVGSSYTLTTLNCGYNLPFCSGCVYCGTTWSATGDCAQGDPCYGASLAVTQCGLHGCDSPGGDTCPVVLGCCDAWNCDPSKCGTVEGGKCGSIWISDNMIPSMYGQPLDKWTWTIGTTGVSDYCTVFTTPNQYHCKPVAIQNGGNLVSL